MRLVWKDLETSSATSSATCCWTCSATCGQCESTIMCCESKCINFVNVICRQSFLFNIYCRLDPCGSSWCQARWHTSSRSRQWSWYWIKPSSCKGIKDLTVCIILQASTVSRERSSTGKCCQLVSGIRAADSWWHWSRQTAVPCQGQQAVCLFEANVWEDLLQALHVGTSGASIQPWRFICQASQCQDVQPAAVWPDACKVQLNWTYWSLQRQWVSEQFLNGTSAHNRLYSAMKLL